MFYKFTHNFAIASDNIFVILVYVELMKFGQSHETFVQHPQLREQKYIKELLSNITNSPGVTLQ